MEINRYIDHTLLKANALASEISKLCLEAKQYHFKSVCVNPGFVSLAKKELQGSDVLVCTVIGFPLGATTCASKVSETSNALKDGADEIDMVINISHAKMHDYQYIENEIKAIKTVCQNHTLKVILETCLLTDEEIVATSLAAKNAGADFVKTSTGFSTGGATIHAVSLMRKTVGETMGVKASGGIHTYQEALEMINAGATRIGASSGVAIMQSLSK
ncbi:MAG: deoxyribose-phosphate aldolase [Bacilli bacterium]|nr:deoxyribose-phosphate aldolase [Bacilli bacterium]